MRTEWAERLLPATKLRRPEGPGPFPIALHFHGCGGPRPLEEGYARAALGAGYAVLAVDSFAPRGISRLSATLTVCTGLSLHGSQRAADVYAIYDWARRQSWVDKSRIVLTGWSHGGWTVMDALAMSQAQAARLTGLADLPPRPLMGLAGAVLIYPYASFPSMTRQRGWAAERPFVYGLMGGRDQVVGDKQPGWALERLKRDGLTVETLRFEDATHAFDDLGASDPRTEYRADLTARAHDWYAKALKSTAKRNAPPDGGTSGGA